MKKVIGISNVTQKGQVTIPAALRKKLSIKESDQVMFIQKEKEVVIAPLVEDITDFFGFHKKLGKKALKPKEVEAKTKLRIAKEITKEGR